jgi:2-isopropylmalate synthase
VDGKEEHTAAEGVGPVSALDRALRKSLTTFFPCIKDIHLTDYKVSVLNPEGATDAKVRVLIETSDATTPGELWASPKASSRQAGRPSSTASPTNSKRNTGKLAGGKDFSLSF